MLAAQAHQETIVIVHEPEAADMEGEAAAHWREQFQEMNAATVVAKDAAPLIAAPGAREAGYCGGRASRN
jgi:hypothetical protein